MAVIIGVSAWGGTKLDEKYQTSEPYFTIVLSLLGIGASLYLTIKEVIKASKENESK